MLTTKQRKPSLNRRKFLGLSATALAVGASTLTVPAQAIPFYNYPVRQLTFVNTHTNEIYRGTYFYNGGYDRAVMSQFSYLMRDHRAEEVARIDYRLFDVLHRLQASLRNFDAVQLISGYRSPQTNAMLASRSSGVAKNSYHVKGQATDIRMDGIPTEYVHRAALSLAAGGVGYYPASDFVHVDTGPVRTWGYGAG
ncbi:MAG: YcbK family protein [Alphaproteobacteria bacterium]|nr:YcbK family protein [Alphaproteobacteria bacterium]